MTWFQKPYPPPPPETSVEPASNEIENFLKGGLNRYVNLAVQQTGVFDARARHIVSVFRSQFEQALQVTTTCPRLDVEDVFYFEIDKLRFKSAMHLLPGSLVFDVSFYGGKYSPFYQSVHHHKLTVEDFWVKKDLSQEEIWTTFVKPLISELPKNLANFVIQKRKRFARHD